MSTASMSISMFANALGKELGSESYVRFLASEGALMVVTLTTREPLLSICLKDAVHHTCSIWKTSLSDDNMTKHMEDDVGIYDELSSFAKYFSTALVAGVSIARLKDYFPLKLDSDQLQLKLLYSIGSAAARLEGHLKLTLVQGNLDDVIFDMMAASAKVSLGKQFSAVGQTSSAAFPSSPANDFASSSQATQGHDHSDIQEPATPIVAEEAPVRAKKRKAVGVSLFAKKVR
eukprot:scaffold3873_cov177-Ochromonas_danica.AAC.13